MKVSDISLETTMADILDGGLEAWHGPKEDEVT